MTDDVGRDPELEIAMDRYARRTEPGPMRVVATVLVLLLHAFLVYATVVFVSLSTMSLDPCAYVECGDEAWAHRAVALAYLGSGVLFVASLGIAVWRMITSRKALAPALILCGLQVALVPVCLQVMRLAGPVS